MGDRGRIAEMLAELDTYRNGSDISRATSPGGGEVTNANGHQLSRGRPRTFPYGEYLPYESETPQQRWQNLDEITKHLYMAIRAGDFTPGAVHWTRELRGWLNLKFDMTKEQRIRLVQVYYHLTLAPGMDVHVSERFASMFMTLTKRKHYLKPLRDLTLDWRPLYQEVKTFVLPSEAGLLQGATVKKNHRTLIKMCTFAQLYFDPREGPAMLEEFLPYFNTSFTEGAFVIAGLLMQFFPTSAAPVGEENLTPQHYLPTFFHLWSLVNRSRVFDTMFVDLFSRLARDNLAAEHIPLTAYGIFTQDQSALIFTAILRILQIPVGQATSAYSDNVDAGAGLGVILERDPKKHPIAHQIARWIIMSLSPESLEKDDSILSNLEGLIQAVETFFHPSNSGSWTKTLCQLIYYLSDFFVVRWNSERSGEMEVPANRKLNDEIKRRFVLCLRDVSFMGIYSKSGTAMNFCLSTLQSLAYLEPTLILPGALQRIYPSIQGLVEVHRTTSSLRALQVLARTMIRTKGFRCHITSLLGLTLPGIDANDLDKTLYSLSFLQAVCYNIPFMDLTDAEDTNSAIMPAMDFVSSEVARMEQEGANFEANYAQDLTDEDEELILRASTAGFSEFLSSFLGKVFTLLENLPDTSRVRSGSPEENVINTLPATFTPLLGALSPELYDLALNKIFDFVSNHVVHQARDAMAFICNSLCKINPEKSHKKLIPMLIAAIRTDIDENGAASTRNTGSEILPRDRSLVWNVSMLGMCVIHVGDSVLKYKQDLLDISIYMQEKCRGVATTHISNFIHHLLLNLTTIYTVDYSLYEPDVLARGLGPGDWGVYPKPNELHIKWHTPSPEEVSFAVEVFRVHGEIAIKSLRSLIDGTSSVKREDSGKAWSDEVARNLQLVRLLISGISHLFDSKASANSTGYSLSGDVEMADANGHVPEENENADSLLVAHEEEEVRPNFKYSDGYAMSRDSPEYEEVHRLRNNIGQLLHDVHRFLVDNQEDDVISFTPLYTAYKCWIVDFGIEKSAHTLDRVLRLFAADIQPYKVAGIRKEYPRVLLLRRAGVYHLQRVKVNASPRPPTDLEKQLLLDLAESSVSWYTDVRRNAQSAIESAAKAIIGARPLLIPTLLNAFEEGVKNNDYARIKGAIYTLLFGTMLKALSRDWRFAPRILRSYIAACDVDKNSVQKITGSAVFQLVEFGRLVGRRVLVDREILDTIAPATDYTDIIDKRIARIKRKRAAQEKAKADLADELVNLTRTAHWKTASRSAAVVITFGMRFETLASDNLIDLLARGTIDSHPGLRSLYSGAFTAFFSLLATRVIYNHDYQNYILDKQDIPGKIEVPTERDDSTWTERYLASFAKPKTDYYIDHEHPGWLVWREKMPAYVADLKDDDRLDEVEKHAASTIGAIIDNAWLEELVKYLLQEPRDSSADRFRISNAMLLSFVFEIMHRGFTKLTFADLKDIIKTTFGDGTDKHRHRATAELMGGLLGSVNEKSESIKSEVWEFVLPIVLGVFNDGLTPENSTYWNTFLHLVSQARDPRRLWPFMEWLSSFKLDMSTSAAFKESAKVTLIQQLIAEQGWHFQLAQPLLDDFLAHLDHPYKAVREAIGTTVAYIYRTRYHESYKDVETLLQAQKAASDIGTRPYEPTEDLRVTIHDVFKRIADWKTERQPGQQAPSAYTSASKTVLLWLDSMLSSYECTFFIEFIPDLIMEPVLHMMDVKEDQELQGLAYHVFRHFPNLPHRTGEDAAMISALIRIGTHSPFWHQRLRILINVQIIYFRRLFLLSKPQQEALFNCIADMLNDSQLEVRMGAAATLSGMIRCSRLALRETMVKRLKDKFTKMLLDNPLPKRTTRMGLLSSTPSTGASTPTPEHTRLVLTRHAAVLGLGALVQAFPYTSPPPAWIPGVLATLANKANADPGVVGKSVKSILSDFKKTRQDTWQMDLKAFSPEQVEDLEGVLWKSYFA